MTNGVQQRLRAIKDALAKLDNLAIGMRSPTFVKPSEHKLALIDRLVANAYAAVDDLEEHDAAAGR